VRIPVPNRGNAQQLGNRGPDRMGPAQFDTRGIDGGLSGVRDLAAGAQQLARGLQAQQQSDLEEADALARAKAANGALDYELKIKAKTADLEARRLDGTLSLDDYEETARTELEEIEQPAATGLHPADAERYAGGLRITRESALQGVGVTVRSARREELKGQIGLLADNLGKFASDPNADLGAIIEKHAALAPAYQKAGIGDFAKQHQAFADRLYYDNAKAQLNVVRGDLAGLSALEQSITGEGGRFAGHLDADKQNALLSQISTYRSQLEAKQDREADRIEAKADRAMSTLERYQAEGIEPPLDELEKLHGAVAPSSRAGEWGDMITAMREAREIAKLPPDQQLRYVEQQEAKLGGRLTLAQKRNIETVRSNYEQRKKELREDPLGYDAKVQGYTVPPLDLQSMLTGDPSTMQAQIAGRMDLVASARKRYGLAAGLSPLRPQEAEAIARAIDQSPPQQVVKFYGNLRQVFGDDRAYLAVMGQIAKDSPVRAHAGALALVNPKGADLIVRGAALLSPSQGEGKGTPFPMPPQSQFETAVAGAVGDAFADGGELYQRALQVVRAGYAGAAERDGDVSGELSDDRVQKIIRATLGTPVDVNGQKVLAPVGWDEGRFETALDAAWQAAPRPANSGELDDYRLVQFGDKAFRFVRGRKFLTGADGQPLTVTLK
jgi:hypothetical protein